MREVIVTPFPRTRTPVVQLRAQDFDLKKENLNMIITFIVF
jgi:hypothetical protein